MDSEKMQHLEFIQSNIARMNQCSFRMKGWAITILTAFLAIYAAADKTKLDTRLFFGVSVIPIILFWGLDSYYFQQERKFRGLYDDVAEINENSKKITHYAMSLSLYKTGRYSYKSALLSESVLYMVLILIVVLFTTTI